MWAFSNLNSLRISTALHLRSGRLCFFAQTRDDFSQRQAAEVLTGAQAQGDATFGYLPVGAGHLGQLEDLELARTRHVRATTKVFESPWLENDERAGVAGAHRCKQCRRRRPRHALRIRRNEDGLLPAQRGVEPEVHLIRLSATRASWCSPSSPPQNMTKAFSMRS